MLLVSGLETNFFPRRADSEKEEMEETYVAGHNLVDAKLTSTAACKRGNTAPVNFRVFITATLLS